ncbi:hypothetical protein CLAIMM_07474 [Cladophialophora immunda]|nr:hypothetical protein CLAIMM_07474 [Cladophialophora immunda]
MSSQTVADNFDYIVIGGGTAGLVVASRLSEDPDVRVLVVEAGADRSDDPLVTTPGLAGGMYGKDEYDWTFKSLPQPGLGGRSLVESRGRMLGGSSAMNLTAMVYPSRASLDAWGQLGNEGWSFDTMTPYFHKSTTTHDPSAAVSEAYGMSSYYDSSLSGKTSGGPVQVMFTEGPDAEFHPWAESLRKVLGTEMHNDPRTGATIGSFRTAGSIDPTTRTRSFAVPAYLGDTARQRKNLVVLTETRVSRIVLETSNADGTVSATGAELLLRGGAQKIVSANNEVILAAGALQSPQLLELSGVGGRDILERNGISVVVDNPNVGEHFSDHPCIWAGFEVASGVAADVLRDPAAIGHALAEYQATRSGILSQNQGIMAYLPLVDGSGPMSSEVRDELLQKHLAPPTQAEPASLSTDAPRRRVLRWLLEQPAEPALQLALVTGQMSMPEDPKALIDHFTPRAPENYFSIMVFLSYPVSTGSCHITSPSISDKPAWDPRSLTEEIDLELYVRAMQFLNEFVATEPFRSRLKPGGKQIPLPLSRDPDAIKEHVRHSLLSAQHVHGGCAMMPRQKGGVVNSKLKVYGVNHLRVVDASVFPLPVVGNIQSVVYAVAERAANLIKADRSGGIREQ